KIAHAADDPLPERRRVGLEDDRAHALLDRFLQKQEVSAYAHVHGRVTVVGAAGSVDLDAAAERSKHVHALSVKPVLLGGRDNVGRLERAPDEFVGGRLVDPALRVHAGVNASHVAGRGLRIAVVENDPGEVHGGELRRLAGRVRAGTRVRVFWLRLAVN